MDLEEENIEFSEIQKGLVNYIENPVENPSTRNMFGTKSYKKTQRICKIFLENHQYITGPHTPYLQPKTATKKYSFRKNQLHIVIVVKTVLCAILL